MWVETSYVVQILFDKRKRNHSFRDSGKKRFNIFCIIHAYKMMSVDIGSSKQYCLWARLNRNSTTKSELRH